ncbi:MAG: aminopeptidase, partial [Steroidobacteraceae bacterium]
MLPEAPDPPSRSPVFPRLGAGALGAAALLLFQGCGTLYLLQAARGEHEVLAKRRPIAAVIADPRTAEPLRAKLETVQDLRAFAVAALGLPDGRSYRSYADIGRPFVVWNVVAAPEFSVEPLRWCFPVAGCVAYRGYFREAQARAFARRLQARGRDVFVGGVPAYSTLGRFADPVLSTLIGYSDVELAAIVFHELAHQVVYVQGASEFNEAFAITVEAAALVRWLEARGRHGELDAYRLRRARQQTFIERFAQARLQLRALYAEALPPAVMRTRKQAMFAALDAELRTLEQQFDVRSGYDSWLEHGLNNAHVAAVATYFECAPGFERLLAAQGGDLPRFYAAARVIAQRPRAERDA